MDESVIVECACRKDASGKREEGYLFRFDEVWRNGLLKITKEYSLWYWPKSNSWNGDVIDASGWHDITFEECMELVARKGLSPIGQDSPPLTARAI